MPSTGAQETLPILNEDSFDSYVHFSEHISGEELASALIFIRKLYVERRMIAKTDAAIDSRIDNVLQETALANIAGKVKNGDALTNNLQPLLDQKNTLRWQDVRRRACYIGGRALIHAALVPESAPPAVVRAETSDIGRILKGNPQGNRHVIYGEGVEGHYRDIGENGSLFLLDNTSTIIEVDLHRHAVGEDGVSLSVTYPEVTQSSFIKKMFKK